MHVYNEYKHSTNTSAYYTRSLLCMYIMNISTWYKYIILSSLELLTIIDKSVVLVKT